MPFVFVERTFGTNSIKPPGKRNCSVTRKKIASGSRIANVRNVKMIKCFYGYDFVF
jgi:hypothetical protein